MIEKNCKICKDLYDFREATPIYCRDAKFCVSTFYGQKSHKSLQILQI